MLITFGKHQNKTAEKLFFESPDYIYWVICQRNLTGQLLHLQTYCKSMINIFDVKKYNKPCYSCKSPSTNSTTYIGNSAPYFWCDSCDPYCNGAESGKLLTINTFAEVMSYDTHYVNNKENTKSLLRALGCAKGLKSRLTVQNLYLFFNH